MKIDSQRDARTTTKQSINLRKSLVSITIIYAIVAAASTAIVRIALTVSYRSPSLPHHMNCIALMLVEHLGCVGFKI